jgi:plasmid maintenance system killer protein
MNIIFATTALRKQLNEEKEMVKIHGVVRAKKLRVILTSLRAAANLGTFAPPMSPPHRCHELTGNLKGQLSVDLDHPYRLLFRPNHEPLPMREEGGLDWKLITDIEVLGIKDTH